MQGGVASISLFAGADAVKSSQEKKGAERENETKNEHGDTSLRAPIASAACVVPVA